MQTTRANLHKATSVLMGGVAILFACSTTRQAVESTNERRGLPKAQSLYEEIHSVGIESTQKNAVPGVAVALIQNGKIAWVQCMGYADVASKKPIRPQTIFNVGSVSKMVAAWGFMQLTEKGLVSLDEPVNQAITRWQLLPSPCTNSQITLRRILSHTAGLSVHGYGGVEQGTPLLGLEESLNGKTKRNGESVRLVSEPGTKWEYSGGGYTLAQLLLEEKTKDTFAEYMKNNVFQPLGLRHTSYEWTAAMEARSATAYDTAGKPIRNRLFTEQAAAGLQTTVLDLAHFAELSLSADSRHLQHVLRPETIRLMQEPVLPVAADGESGLGYRVMKYENLRTLGHTGENIGWTAAVFLHVPTKSGLVILCNGSNGDKVWYPMYQKWAKKVQATQSGVH